MSLPLLLSLLGLLHPIVKPSAPVLAELTPQSDVTEAFVCGLDQVDEADALDGPNGLTSIGMMEGAFLAKPIRIVVARAIDYVVFAPAANTCSTRRSRAPPCEPVLN